MTARIFGAALATAGVWQLSVSLFLMRAGRDWYDHRLVRRHPVAAYMVTSSPLLLMRGLRKRPALRRFDTGFLVGFGLPLAIVFIVFGTLMLLGVVVDVSE